jgi:hypothetical protein
MMPRIFLVYIPPGNAEAIVHYEETIKQRGAPDRIYPHIPPKLRDHLERIFSGRPITVWGSNDSTANRSKFEQMAPGDEILIVEGPTIKLLGKVAATTINPSLSAELWKPLRTGQSSRWDLIYFIANPLEINLPFSEFCRLMGYAENYQLRGFTTVGSKNLKSFYDRYDDLYSVLILTKQQLPVYERPKTDLFDDRQVEVAEVDTPAPVETEDEASAPEPVLSDHLRMQWTLLRLGQKAGSKVWIPANDQGRIRDRYHFSDFDPDLTAGIDAQTRYVENIDVIWKEEFRIDAAFEIENSTSIYSGLLRFSDLTLVAPNTVYPLFIVAPRDKRNRLVEQLRRPTFRKMRLDRKVRYLPYEAVDEIDRFFINAERGMTIDVIVERSEEIHEQH